jgi:DNA mismatch repair protein MutL
MLLVDQHALHERILFEELRVRVSQLAVEVQELLVPEPVPLSPAEVGALLDQEEVLAKVGLRVEEFGQQCILLRGYPAMLRRLRPEALLRDIAHHLLETGRTPTHGQLLEELLHLMACKAAVKAGDPLTNEEIEQLLDRRHLVEDSHHCPHGRPTVLRFTLQDLERQFKRI